MAEPVKRGNRWFAQVRKRGHSISKSHPTKAAAKAWQLQIEAEIENGTYGKAPAETLGEVIDIYRSEREKSNRPICKTSNEHYMLKMLSARLGDKRIATLSVQDVVAYAQQRLTLDKVSPYTVNMDISKLGTVIRHMRSLLGIKVGNVADEARPLLNNMQLIGPSRLRERRPDIAEIRALFDWFEANADKTAMPMIDILTVGMTTAMRRGEIFRVLWKDLDTHRRLLLIRDRKDPKHKAGNHQWIPVLPEAMEVISRQPKIDERIFPYGAQRASQLFKIACEACGIKDLRLHDMRHEAASSLFEAGWDIPQVAMVTSHKNWKTLQRYVNLRPDDLHDNVVPISKAKKASAA